MNIPFITWVIALLPSPFTESVNGLGSIVLRPKFAEMTFRA